MQGKEISKFGCGWKKKTNGKEEVADKRKKKIQEHEAKGKKKKGFPFSSLKKKGVPFRLEKKKSNHFL